MFVLFVCLHFFCLFVCLFVRLFVCLFFCLHFFVCTTQKTKPSTTATNGKPAEPTITKSAARGEGSVTTVVELLSLVSMLLSFLLFLCLLVSLMVLFCYTLFFVVVVFVKNPGLSSFICACKCRCNDPRCWVSIGPKCDNGVPNMPFSFGLFSLYPRIILSCAPPANMSIKLRFCVTENINVEKCSNEFVTPGCYHIRRI